MTDKRRLDQMLVEKGLAESRSRAQSLILAGKVTVDGKISDKPGRTISGETPIAVTGIDHPWVSRGGVKLAAALDHFGVDPSALIALDLGASTGGFTDVLLERRAKRVYAVDVGHSQLASKLRDNPRVVVLEHLNARYLGLEHIPEPIDLIVCDVSFIGLQMVLPAAFALSAAGARLVALIKPQFEAGRGAVGKGGVVRDEAIHADVRDRLTKWLNAQADWQSDGIIESPIKGPDGNREFLIGGHRN